VFEPILFHLFLFHASVNFFQFFVQGVQFLLPLFSFTIQNSTLFVLFDSVQYFSFICSSNQKNAQDFVVNHMIAVLPLNSKVLWSVMSSTIIEVLKKRWTLMRLLQVQKEADGRAGTVGMPPSYIVVETYWDDTDNDPGDDKTDLELVNVKHCSDNPIEDKIVSKFNESESPTINQKTQKRTQEIFKGLRKNSEQQERPIANLPIRNLQLFKLCHIFCLQSDIARICHIVPNCSPIHHPLYGEVGRVLNGSPKSITRHLKGIISPVFPSPSYIIFISLVVCGAGKENEKQKNEKLRRKRRLPVLPSVENLV